MLIPGDISWALRLEDALLDLEWIEKRPGTKVIIKGNHDYWWSALSKVKKVLPPSIHLIQNSSVTIGDVSIAGTRLWNSPEYSFDHIIDFKPCITEKKREEMTFIGFLFAAFLGYVIGFWRKEIALFFKGLFKKW